MPREGDTRSERVGGLVPQAARLVAQPRKLGDSSRTEEKKAAAEREKAEKAEKAEKKTRTA